MAKATTKVKSKETASTPTEAAKTDESSTPTPKGAAKRRGRPRHAKRGVKPAKSRVTSKRRRSRRKRYTPAEKANILAAARNEGLTGAQVAKRFGVSTLSYYTWRKKAKAGKPRQSRRAGITGQRVGKTVGIAVNLAEMIRHEIRAQISRVTPEIIQSEVARVFSGTPGRRRR